METRLWNILQATFILVMLGISVQAQPALVTEVPNRSTNFVTVGDLVFFTSGDSLLRTDGTASGTILLKSGFNFGMFQRFTGHDEMLYFTNSSSRELWRSDGT